MSGNVVVLPLEVNVEPFIRKLVSMEMERVERLLQYPSLTESHVILIQLSFINQALICCINIQVLCGSHRQQPPLKIAVI